MRRFVIVLTAVGFLGVAPVAQAAAPTIAQAQATIRHAWRTWPAKAIRFDHCWRTRTAAHCDWTLTDLQTCIHHVCENTPLHAHDIVIWTRRGKLHLIWGSATTTFRAPSWWEGL